jgi:F-type H+-transporting ATPase subunit epsilon
LAKTFRCRLITPAAQVLDEQVTYASVPAWDGLFGVLPGRAPIVATLGLGELRLQFPDASGAAGGERSFLVEDGFVQMVNDKLTVLAAKAFPVETLVAADAEKELAQANAKAVTEPDPTKRKVETERLAKDRARARAKVRLAKKASGRGI